MLPIILNGRQYRYQIIRKPIRSLNLRLKSAHSFVVSAPRLTPNFTINKFIREHSPWIVKHSQKFLKKRSLTKLKSLVILDQEYDFIIVRTTKDSLVIFSEDQKIYLNTSKLTHSHLKKILDIKLRPFAFRLINSHLSLLSPQFGFKYNRVTVRNQSSRFGSCSHQGNLNFNWQIIFFPLDKFRHLLLHELTHLAIKNHSPKFWSQLALYDPDWKINRRWLRENSAKYFLR